jgi:hypothetical protein
MIEESKAHDLVLSFCRHASTARTYGGNFGMRQPTNPTPGAECMVMCLDWTTHPLILAQASTWEQVYVQLAACQALDIARVEHETYMKEVKAEKERQAQRTYKRRRWHR